MKKKFKVFLPYDCNDLSNQSIALGCVYNVKQHQPETQQMRNNLQKEKSKLCTGFCSS